MLVAPTKMAWRLVWDVVASRFACKVTCVVWQRVVLLGDGHSGVRRFYDLQLEDPHGTSTLARQRTSWSHVGLAACSGLE